VSVLETQRIALVTLSTYSVHGFTQSFSTVSLRHPKRVRL
jgi:hypothetical protein